MHRHVHPSFQHMHASIDMYIRRFQYQFYSRISPLSALTMRQKPRMRSAHVHAAHADHARHRSRRKPGATDGGSASWILQCYYKVILLDSDHDSE